MQNYSHITPDSRSAASTAHHMADAVGYLMRVAAEAGLPTIVGKLANIRANLLSLASTEAPDTGADNSQRESGKGKVRGSAHERRRPH
jgi:hypothetical protein